MVEKMISKSAAVALLAALGLGIAVVPASASAVTCVVGGGTAPSGWTLFGVGGGVAATSAPYISPSASPTDCYIMTDTGAGWPGDVASGFDITTIPGIPNIVDTVPGTTNGSAMLSPIFTSTAGQSIKFDFSFITNDGTGTFSDWAAAYLLPVDAAGNAIGAALNLFTARTSDNSQVVPGYGFSAFPPGLTLTPNTAFLQGDTFCLNGSTGGTSCSDPNATQFGPVRYDYPYDPTVPIAPGAPPGGSTPWISANYLFDSATAGTYKLVMAVGNVGDQIYSTGLLFAGSSITGGNPVEPEDTIPEPASIALFGGGLAAIGSMAAFRRRKRAV
jgi:hypothetical protein